MGFCVLGTGHFVPEKIVKNSEFPESLGTSDEWIQKRIGIKERHVCTTESNVDLAVEAAMNALENSGVKACELDLILGATVSGDSVSPGLACMVQNRIGATCPSFDVAAACSGFTFLLEVAAGYFARKTVKKVLVVGSERMSGILDWNDRGTCVIFGDGSGAAVLGEGDNYLASYFYTHGGDDVVRIPNHSGNSPFYKRELEPNVVHMKGQETYKFAITNMVKGIHEVLKRANVQPVEIDLVIPHQANYRIIHEASKRIPEISSEKFCVNIDRYGNTSSASVPILLDEMNRSGKIKRGNLVLMVAFGGGLSCGASLIRW